MTASESRNQPPLKRARTEPDGFDATSLWKEIMEIDEEHLERGDAPLVVPLRREYRITSHPLVLIHSRNRYPVL